MLAMALTACDRDTTTAPGAVDPHSAAATIGPLAARAIALAMAETPIRMQVLMDLRDSPYSEHKVVLQNYLRTPGGLQLLAAIDRAGIGADALAKDLQQAPQIQFYVPGTAQRASWRATPDILVVPNLTSERPEAGFTSAGVTQRVDLAHSMPDGLGALFILQWAEPMFRRWAGPTKATETIQATGESQIGSGRVVRDAAGRVIEPVDDTPEGHSGPSPVTQAGEPAGTYLRQLVNHGVCDNLCFPDEHLEFEFRSTASDNPNQYISANLTGISPGSEIDPSVWTGWWQVHSSRVINGVTMEVQVWETDGSSGDDRFLCQVGHPNCHFDVTNWPWLIEGSPWSFPLCEGQTFGCTHDPSDLEVLFTDRSTPVVTTVTVLPTSATMCLNGSSTLTATAKDQYGDVWTSGTMGWSSSNSGIAAVQPSGSRNGIVGAVAEGQATITGTLNGVNGTSAVTVIYCAPQASVYGPYTMDLYQYGRFTATGSAGVPPYTYEFRRMDCPVGGFDCQPWGMWNARGSTNYWDTIVYGCNIQHIYVQSRVTDSRGNVSAPSVSWKTYINNPC
jgi:hypothetical protein